VTPDERTLDLMFQSLADATRRAMVARLTQGPATVSELAAPFDMALPTVLQHIRVLEHSGLVATEKAGRVRTCRLQPQALSQAERWLTERRLGLERAFDRLGAYLNGEDG
jgi:DNA-binding transcriptional ArsR family regulator